MPNQSDSEHVLFELQLGLFDFCDAVELDRLPMWASQFKHRTSGYQFALPVVMPRSLHVQMRLRGTSTFHITQESYAEVGPLPCASLPQYFKP